jgi:hypothetical protein
MRTELDYLKRRGDDFKVDLSRQRKDFLVYVAQANAYQAKLESALAAQGIALPDGRPELPPPGDS